MPNDENSLNWEKVISIGIEFLGSSAAETILSMIFNNKSQSELQTMITTAVEEICTRITKAIDDAFMKEYIANTDSISMRLSAYNDTKDRDLLDELFADASDTVSNLKRFNNIEGILAFNYACTLNLAIIQALSEFNEGYKKTLSDVGKQYSEWSRLNNGRIVQITTESVGNVPITSLSSLSSLTSPYEIKETREGFNTVAYLTFYAGFYDSWIKSWTRSSSDPIKLDQSWYGIDPPHPKLILTDIGLSELEEKYYKFIANTEQQRNSYLENKLVFPRSVEEKILLACNKWDSL